MHPDFNENYDLSEDVGIPSALTSSEPLILNELQDQDYRAIGTNTEPKAKRIFLSHLASH